MTGITSRANWPVLRLRSGGDGSEITVESMQKAAFKSKQGGGSKASSLASWGRAVESTGGNEPDLLAFLKLTQHHQIPHTGIHEVEGIVDMDVLLGERVVEIIYVGKEKLTANLDEYIHHWESSNKHSWVGCCRRIVPELVGKHIVDCNQSTATYGSENMTRVFDLHTFRVLLI